MNRCLSAQQVLDEIFSGAVEEQEDEDVSEEEDGEECNPEDEASSDEEEEEIPQADRETFLSKNGKIAWSSSNSDSNQGRTAASNIIRMTPGPTRYSAAHVQDISSTFLLFITPAIEKIILENTKLEGFRKYGENWKNMDEIDLRGYIGLLILAGVYRSRGEATYREGCSLSSWERLLSPCALREGSACLAQKPLQPLWKLFKELYLVLIHLRLQLGQSKEKVSSVSSEHPGFLLMRPTQYNEMSFHQLGFDACLCVSKSLIQSECEPHSQLQ
ncbi:hypothetical protein SRHO_G00090110 [Serrasalmus rhombeus]